MTCEATEDALQRRLDGGGGLDEAARAHLDACAACQGFARGLALLEDTMSAMTTDTLNQLPLTAIRERVARVGRAQRRAIPLIAAGLLVTLPLVAAVGGSDALILGGVFCGVILAVAMWSERARAHDAAEAERQGALLAFYADEVRARETRVRRGRWWNGLAAVLWLGLAVGGAWQGVSATWVTAHALFGLAFLAGAVRAQHELPAVRREREDVERA